MRCLVLLVTLVPCLLVESSLMRAIESTLPCYTNPNADGTCPYDDITFWLYTKNEPNGIQITDENMISLPIDEKQPWKIIFHGFMSSKDMSPGKDLRDAYFSRGSYNVLCVDYSKPYMVDQGYICYPKAALESLDLVSRCSAKYLEKLLNAGVLPSLDNLHVIGHSLGAHTAGDVCNRLNALGKGTVRRLTGLDPAGPFFNKNFTQPSRIFDETDAQFVDAYHTNGGNSFFQFGTKQRLGSVDVIFNGGGLQPGCNDEISCNHQRAVDYFAESIHPPPPAHLAFVGYAENSTTPVPVGEDIAFDVRGSVFVKTNREPPYAQGAQE